MKAHSKSPSSKRASLWGGEWLHGWPETNQDAFEPEAPKDKPLSKSVRRPFVSKLPAIPTGRVLECLDAEERRIRLHHFSLSSLIGCKVFDGLCLWQDEPEEIDCSECVRATFEAFIRGCNHREYYVDPFGTIRCAACKIELGQFEDPDVYEDDDPPEEDDFQEPDEEAVLHSLTKIRPSWVLEGILNQDRRRRDRKGG